MVLPGEKIYLFINRRGKKCSFLKKAHPAGKHQGYVCQELPEAPAAEEGHAEGTRGVLPQTSQRLAHKTRGQVGAFCSAAFFDW